jgi:hypothetical protein
VDHLTLLDADKAQRLELFGEDSRALLHVVQESFGIELTTDELVGAETVGMLCDCICGKLKQPLSERCLSAVVFYQLRQSFIILFETQRSMIDPDTLLTELVPWTNRRGQWRKVQEHLGLVLPDLTWPVWLICLSLLISGSVDALVFPRWMRSFTNVGFGADVLGLLCVLLTWGLVLRLLSPLARTFPRSCRTFGDLVRFTLARNYATVASQDGRSSQVEVLLPLRYLVAVQVGKDVKDITPQTRFPEGLNIY